MTSKLPKLIVNLNLPKAPKEKTLSSFPKVQLAPIKKWITATLNFVNQVNKNDSLNQVNHIIHIIYMAKEIEINVTMVDETTSAALNKQYRHKNKSTNILSFPYISASRSKAKINAIALQNQLLGDLVICIPIVKEEAQKQEKTFIAHLAHLVIHGTLHLLGYTHDRIKDSKVMENHEIAILKKLKYQNPYD